MNRRFYCIHCGSQLSYLDKIYEEKTHTWHELDVWIHRISLQRQCPKRLPMKAEIVITQDDGEKFCIKMPYVASWEITNDQSTWSTPPIMFISIRGDGTIERIPSETQIKQLVKEAAKMIEEAP